METSTQNRTNADWEQAKQEGKQRAERISEIFKAAAAEAFSEIKAGSVELNGLTRKSVAEWLEELQETAEKADVETIQTDATVEHPDAGNTAVPPVPTWRELILTSLGIVRDRKGDWFQQLLVYWKAQTTKADAEMNKEYGDRYTKVKSVFRRIVSWVEANLNESVTKAEVQTAKPVNIEVMDEDEPATASPRTIEMLETADAQERPAQ